jgi:hypothetical protein
MNSDNDAGGLCGLIGMETYKVNMVVRVMGAQVYSMGRMRR